MRAVKALASIMRRLTLAFAARRCDNYQTIVHFHIHHDENFPYSEFVFQDIEERAYKPAKWVSTTVKEMEHEKARSAGFRKLFKYITGENEKGMVSSIA